VSVSGLPAGPSCKQRPVLRDAIEVGESLQMRKARAAYGAFSIDRTGAIGLPAAVRGCAPISGWALDEIGKVLLKGGCDPSVHVLLSRRQQGTVGSRHQRVLNSRRRAEGIPRQNSNPESPR